MINEEHHEHKLCCCIICAYHHEGKLLGKLMAKPSKTPSNELADIAVNHFAIQHAREQVSHSSKPVDTICQDKGQTAHTSHSSHGHTPSAPSKGLSQLAPNNTELVDQTAQHMIPIVPKCDKMGHWGCPNAMVASHSNQGMHLHLGHSRGSPDALQGTTTTAKGRKTRHMHHKCQRGPQPSRLNSPTPHPTQHDNSESTHPKEIMVRDVHAPQCNEAYTTIQLPASASRKGTASLCVKVRYQSWRQCVTPPCVLMPIPRSDQSSWPTHWPRPCQYQAHCIQQIPYTSIWCTLRTHHLATKSPWLLTPTG